MTYLGVYLDPGYPGAVLPTVVLFFHKQVHLVQPPEGRAVFFLIVREWFEQAYKRYAAFVFYLVAHFRVMSIFLKVLK